MLSKLSLWNCVLLNFEPDTPSAFYIKYAFLRVFQKYKSIKKYGWNDRDISKCRLRDIIKYLMNRDDKAISFFEDRVKEYLNLLLKDQNIQRIIVVTHPHIGHLYGYKLKENEKKIL